MAPELFTAEAYGKAVDVWAVGVTMFVLLAGRYPFHHHDPKTLRTLITKAKFSFEGEIWDSISDEARDLLCKIFVADPRQRYTINQVLLHPWLLNCY
jgi:calcium/calmodulin-dependent protein kinase I